MCHKSFGARGVNPIIYPVMEIVRISRCHPLLAASSASSAVLPDNLLVCITGLGLLSCQELQLKLLRMPGRRAVPFSQTRMRERIMHGDGFL